MSARDHVRTDRRLERLAADPRIVPDLHHVCDGWCDECCFTERCLAFRGRRPVGGTPRRRDAPASVRLELLPHQHLAGPVPETHLTLPDHARAMDIDIESDEALAGAALTYAARSARFVNATGPPLAARVSAKTSPAPGDIILRFHTMVYARTVRALVGRVLTAAGSRAWAAEADACAAQALSCAARSREALTRYPETERRARLILLLDDIVRQLAGRFPAAVAWRARCLQRAADGRKATPSSTSAKFDIGDAELAGRR